MDHRSQDILELCAKAAVAAGASRELGLALGRATVAAQEAGKDALGIQHFFDYLDAVQAHRIDGMADPVISTPTPAVYLADARQGIPHVAFDRVLGDLVRSAHELGLVVLSINNSYTGGALGYFSERIAEEGLVGLVVGNSSAHMAAGGTKNAVLGTNPLSFAVPQGPDRPPLVFDQASSQTAMVNVREAARSGRPIPDDWAVDEYGIQTTDADKALLGALLPFGGYKGTNIALMVEMLATLSGGSWSLDAGSFNSGERSPAIGMFLVAIDPTVFDPQYPQRVIQHVDRLRSQHGMRFPGDARSQRTHGTCMVDEQDYNQLLARAGELAR
ncbi:Ldh family oxidoreductase [Glutamicibacter sp. MNS18]|uniref:Ldh family oxidoreductase n=1 Tax=Glutamicibacter sp. MNS18 TaxID=2989817 RepID=UPI00223555D3|nr:Ldh family oxidoreductase [Glutamicibacter sp. MNS18]MCW4466798.1 Ldh family oxidoreductase [Glutamicibacter sp. MNS18]